MTLRRASHLFELSRNVCLWPKAAVEIRSIRVTRTTATDPKQPYETRSISKLDGLARLSFSALILLTVASQVAIAGKNPFDGLEPSLLAVTISDFEVSASHDSHSSWWTYKAVVEKTVAGPKYEGEITFVIAKALDLRRVFPAQFILVFEDDDIGLEQQFGTRMVGINMYDAKEIVCFSFDLADVFPKDSRFDLSSVNSGFVSEYCYESSYLLTRPHD